ncbi:hypothetical protein [Streptomyces sp. AC495_CC817]|uniref:hypothetical protein n=1 Tax=Streptomyces sp. AC495_CC817 TaxID=2823900 RepID=UPI001C27A2F0|nr:hypothetical protein [Streptomyces sp. AC495_CC817]
MDRRLVLNAQLAIAQGHRVEVTEQFDPETGEPAVLVIVDLDAGIRYRAEDPRGDVSRWLGRVVDCTVTIGSHGAHTVLTVAPDRAGTAGAKAALRGADAAVEAAKAEADRWGGADRAPEPPVERRW